MAILVHAGTAHLDDFLAAAFLAAKTGEPIIRKKRPTEEDLEGENWVIDFGFRHEPEKRNFDHHQIKGENVCAFTQVLEHFEMRDYDIFPWIKFVESWDSNGPLAAMELVGGGDSDFLVCPIRKYMLDEFSAFEGYIDDEFYFLMKGIGNYIIYEFDKYKETEVELARAARIETRGDYTIADYSACKMIDSFQAMKNFEKKNKVDAIYSINTRGAAKWRMIRRNEEIDFNCAKDLPGVEFVHQSAFLITFDGDWRAVVDMIFINWFLDIYTPELIANPDIYYDEEKINNLIAAGDTAAVVRYAEDVLSFLETRK